MITGETFSSASPHLGRLAAMNRASLEALQLRRIQALLERLYARNPFYRDRMDAAGVRPEHIRSLEDFRKRIPVATKQDFLADQEAHPPFGRRLGVPREDVALVTLTGGTSGQGQEVYGRTQRDVHMLGYLHQLPWTMAGLRPGDVAFNCVPAGGMTTGGWGPGEGFRIAGATAFHVGGSLATDAKIDMMLRFREAHFIYASTNYHHTLAEGFRRRGIRPAEGFPMMRTLFTAAEGYPIEWAQELEAFWGCRLHEGYGSTQGVGFIASTCECGAVRQGGSRGCMHFLEWENYAEVIDPDTGEPVGPGEEGEIVLTNLGVEASPVLRFATRDRARFIPHHACGCGRPWNGIEAGGIARYDDMMKIRGNNVWPLSVDNAVFSHAHVEEYAGRVFVDHAGRTEVEVRLALKNDAPADEAWREDLCRTLTERIKAATNVLMNVRVIPREDLPSFSYKARRWTDERREGMRTERRT
ncbi:phenylacetate-coenzyme A ligase [Alsobacter metallidurans]|uniref:Phenylacetate-coenzyme A ligase n=1 Tax=Alsobacter metallidurans TaxID=340221 RepID=A0A917I9K6_9HYPH|nr:AMP-binding protein [Alsobacter metallidurans]GGH27857.1 phenylacetate-coenzyme A ligase [Alsobacter metallidurans]